MPQSKKATKSKKASAAAKRNGARRVFNGDGMLGETPVDKRKYYLKHRLDPFRFPRIPMSHHVMLRHQGDPDVIIEVA